MGIRGILAAAALLTYPASAQAQQVGDWVLSPWQDSTQTFPGVVVARSGNAVTIRFDDGTTETRLADDIRPYDWKRGSRIECQWKDGNWYAARILAMGDDGVTLVIRYDEDGTEERTKTGNCRSPY